MFSNTWGLPGDLWAPWILLQNVTLYQALCTWDALGQGCCGPSGFRHLVQGDPEPNYTTAPSWKIHCCSGCPPILSSQEKTGQGWWVGLDRSYLMCPVSPLQCDQASCLLTGVSTPPSREHPCPQPQMQPSTHFTCSETIFRHVRTYMHTFVGRICRFFPPIIIMKPCHAHCIVLFYHPPTDAAGPLHWALVLSISFTYLLPSQLLWTDHPSLIRESYSVSLRHWGTTGL